MAPGGPGEGLQSRLVLAEAAFGGAAVNRTVADNIVEFLSFSGPSDSIPALNRVGYRDWERAHLWLDDTGLAFYFLQKLKDTNSADVISPSLLSRLEADFAANQGRVENMSRRFDALNHRFDREGVGYAVLKGVSLVPEFCPYAPLRHQSDFDYLVDAQSLPVAQRILVEAGYTQKDSPSSLEFIFVLPTAEAPSRGSTQYSVDAPHSVELHLDVWYGDLNRLPPLPKLFTVERAETHEWNGLTFPALTDEDAFLVQVVHACQHLFGQWIRMSGFSEIGCFLKRRAHDTALWNRVEQRVGDSQMLREFVVLVCELAAKLFASPLPPLVRAWGTKIRPAPRVWIEKYARPYAFCDLPAYQFSWFPRSKLVLFLHSQYETDTTARKVVDLKGALPLSLLSRIASSLRRKPSLVLNVGYWKHQLVLLRTIFHALAGLRYLCEIPRCLWLTRARVRSASPNV
jgi:hypothetical protein